MSKMLPLVFFLAVLLAAPSAQALTDREHLVKWCTGASSVAAGRCIGYLLAAEDALSGDSIEGIRACLPRDTGLQQQHKIVVDWLVASPNATSGTALGLVARAYAQHFPCSR
ncbi:MAG: Rap1a/Tai family immunity protein [Sulfuritalea sp.]|nr:Rap1a/Tai family immunity protein [Sulfuritalea sp.]